MQNQFLRGKLVGQKVIAVYSDGERLDIQLSAGWALTVWNRSSIYGSLQPPTIVSDAKHLEGTAICAIDETENGIQIGFSNDHCLAIDMRDDAYVGPEAFMLTGPEGEIVVGN